MENGAKKKRSTGKHARLSATLFLAPIWASNRFAGPFITAFKVTRPSYFVRVSSYFDALWYPHLYFDRKSNI